MPRDIIVINDIDMDFNEIKKKTDLICIIVTAVCVVAGLIFLVVPRPTIIFGLIVCIALGFASGVSFGAGIVERLSKINEKAQANKN